MLEELEYNLWEHILQRLVDYGHAFSPEIEMAAMDGDEAMLLHGEAVNIDMALTTQVLCNSSVFAPAVFSCSVLFAVYSLPCTRLPDSLWCIRVYLSVYCLCPTHFGPSAYHSCVLCSWLTNGA